MTCCSCTVLGEEQEETLTAGQLETAASYAPPTKEVLVALAPARVDPDPSVAAISPVVAAIVASSLEQEVCRTAEPQENLPPKINQNSDDCSTTLAESSAADSKPSDINLFLEYYDTARFHLAVDELELGPSFQGRRSSVTRDEEFKFRMGEHMANVFREVREAIPTGTLAMQEGQRRAQTRLVKAGEDLDADEKKKAYDDFVSKGFEQVSDGKGGTGIGYLKIDYKIKKTLVSIEMRDLQFPALEFIKLASEVQEAHIWFPFLRTVDILHEWKGAPGCVRSSQLKMKVAFLTIESVCVCVFEDRLQETGTLALYIFSPPDDVMSSKTGGAWLGSQVPGPGKGSFDVRLPIGWNRVIVHPVTRDTVNIRADACMIDKIAPIGWVTRMLYSELSKKLPDTITKTVNSLQGNSIGAAVGKRPEFYEKWRRKLDEHYERLGV